MKSRLYLVGLALLALSVLTGNLVLLAQDNLPLAPGQLVDVGGHKLHIYCEGEGSPTVILEAGFSVPSLHWSPVQQKIAEFTRVCSYDRAGYGWSEAGPMPRTGDVITDELKTLLDNADIQGPYIVVGHSYGGILAIIFASKNTDQVKGLVSIDGTPPGFDTRTVAAVPEFEDFLISDTAFWDGIIEKVKSNTIAEEDVFAHPGVPEDTADLYKQLQLQGKYFAAMYGEITAIAHTNLEAQGITSLGDIPFIILANTTPFSDTEADKTIQGIWLEMQDELAKLSTQGEVRLFDTGHFVQSEKPDDVVAAIKDVVNAAQ